MLFDVAHAGGRPPRATVADHRRGLSADGRTAPRSGFKPAIHPFAMKAGHPIKIIKRASDVTEIVRKEERLVALALELARAAYGVLFASTESDRLARNSASPQRLSRRPSPK